MRKLVIALALVMLPWVARADSGVVNFPRNSWESVQIDRCALAPWSASRNQGVTLIIYPVPFAHDNFLWTTDAATVAVFQKMCADGDQFWAYAPGPGGWLSITHPQH